MGIFGTRTGCRNPVMQVCRYVRSAVESSRLSESLADSASARSDQNDSCSAIQAAAGCSPAERTDSQCSRPRTSRSTRPAASSTPTCRAAAANEIGSGAARSVIRAGPSRNATSIPRRVWSASAAYAWSRRESSIILLTIAKPAGQYSTSQLNIKPREVS